MTKEKVVEGLEERNQSLHSELTAKEVESQEHIAVLISKHNGEKEALEASHNEETTKMKVIIAQLERK